MEEREAASFDDDCGTIEEALKGLEARAGSRAGRQLLEDLRDQVVETRDLMKKVVQAGVAAAVAVWMWVPFKDGGVM